ncbi:MAG: MFS transporter [Solirubrobacteraceae bacterium]
MSLALRSPRVRRILIAYSVNRLGTWIGLVALSLAVFDHTHSATAVASLLVAAQVLPALIMPALVARVEASPRRGELSGLYAFEAVVTACLAVLLGNFWLPAILLLVALDGTAALATNVLLRTEAVRAARDWFESESDAAAPGRPANGERRSPEQAVNAAVNVAFSATFVIGPAVGGAISAGAGASAALVIDAISFAICGALLIDLHPHVEEAGGPSVTSRLKAARAYIASQPTLRALILIQALALVFFESSGPIEVAYAKVTLNAGDRGYGLLLATWGAGVVIGSIVFARLRTRSLGAMLSGGTFAVGLAYIGFAVSPSLAVACCAAVVGGIGNGVQWAPLVTAVQQLTPAALQARVMGGLESIGALSPVVGLSLGAALVAVSSPRVAFLVVGVGAALTTIGFARLRLTPGASRAEAATGAPCGQPGASELSAAAADALRETSSL